MKRFLRSLPRVGLPLLLLIASLQPAAAIRTESHVFEGYPVLSEGELEGTALHWDGGLGAGPTLGKPVRPPEGTVIWDLARAEDGTVYLATGGPGGVFRLDPGADEMKRILSPEAPLLRAIHAGDDGRLYAGSSPDGRLYRVDPGGGFPEIFCDFESLYVWSIQADPDREGALLVGAGAPGRLYRLPADFAPGDEPEVVLETEALHLSAFAFADDGTLYYATGPGGHLLRKAPDGDPETLVELGQGEVRDIFPLDEGGVRIAVFRSDQSGGRGNNGGGPGNNGGNGGSSSVPPDGLPSGIFEIGPDGFVEVLLVGSDEEKVFTAARSQGELLVGSDSRGRLYRFADRFDWSLLAESPAGGEVSALEPVDGETVLVATSNPAALHRLSYDPTAEGTFTAEVFDAGQKVRWGALVAVGGGLDAVEWETRTGDRSRPDASWSDWTSLDDGDKVASPPGRFFQFRARFTKPAAVVRRVEAFYQLPNEAPIFRRVRGLPLRLEMVPVPPQQPGRATLSQLFDGNGKNNGGNHGSNGSMNQPFVMQEDPGWLSIVWEAVDPNQDELRFRLYLRRLEGEDWLLLGEDLEHPFLSLNVAGFEPGYYEPRVEASDRMSNPPDLAKTSETRGSLILVDNQPPEIIPPNRESPLAFTVRDGFSVIASAIFRLEGSEPRALLPADGIFDGTEESFRLPEEAARPGATLLIEATDARGNRATWTGLVPKR